MLLLHISDLHLSRYGEKSDWTQPLPGDEHERWTPIHEWERWRIEGLRDRKDRPERLRLVDPEGVVHQRRKWSGRREEVVVSQLLTIAMERHTSSAEALIKERPTPEDLRALLRLDPGNTNLRFLELVDRVLPLGPELILLTGDMTDNGFGYSLIEHYLAPWIERKALFVVPGNHDTYDMFPRRGRQGRIQAKEERYAAFARKVGCEPNAAGAYVRRVGDVALVGLSSCKPPLTPLSASGEVSAEQLVWLDELGNDIAFKQERLRLCMLHHHLVRMPFALHKRPAIDVGLRLRNAPQVARTCIDAGIDIMLHGHRHHGYVVHLPGHPMVVSSPSSTLGCKSSDKRYVWLIDISRRHPHAVPYVFTEEPAAREEPELENG